jgi:hypothetical protein
MVTDPKFCPTCKNYTDHELIDKTDEKSGSWKCLKCGAIDQYKDFPARKETKKGKNKCDCGGLLIPHPDGSGLFQCEKCKAAIFIMKPDPSISLEKPLEPELMNWMPGPGVNKTAINATSIVFEFDKIEPPKSFDGEWSSKTPKNCFECVYFANSRKPFFAQSGCKKKMIRMALPYYSDDRDHTDEIKKVCFSEDEKPTPNAPTIRGGTDQHSESQPAARDMVPNPGGKAGDEKTQKCLKCGMNSWKSEFDNGVEILTCRTKGCNFKSISPCKDIEPWGDVNLCKHTHSSCNGTRLENKCPRKSKKITKNVNFKGKTFKAKGKITAQPVVVEKLKKALQEADDLFSKARIKRESTKGN